MNKLISFIDNLVNRTSHNHKEVTQCNYANNYYGDQLCSIKQK